MTATKEIAFRERQRQTKALVCRIGTTKADRACGCLFYVHIHNDLLRRRSFTGLDVSCGEEPQRADTFRRFPNFARIEGVAFYCFELTADNTV